MAARRRELTDEQRARNRLVVKRCYYRKLTTLQTLRDEAATLERRHAQLLAAQHRADASPSAARRGGGREQAEEAASRSSAREAFVRLLQLKSALAHEQRALQALEAQFEAAERQVAGLARAQRKTEAAQREEHARARAAAPADLAGFRPLTPAACLAVARAAYREVRAFRASRAACASTGLSFLGWRDRRLLDRQADAVRFSLEKVFEDVSPEWVAGRVWDVLSTPEGVARAYPRSVDARFQLLQRVSDDAVVLYHSLERAGAEDIRVRALILAMRVQVAALADGQADGDAAAAGGPTLVLYRGLDPKRLLQAPAERAERRGRVKLAPQVEDVWMDTFVWGLFERAGERGQHCRDDFGGVIQGTALATTGWWMLEILHMALRLEAEVFGPQMSLCAA